MGVFQAADCFDLKERNAIDFHLLEMELGAQHCAGREAREDAVCFCWPCFEAHKLVIFGGMPC